MSNHKELESEHPENMEAVEQVQPEVTEKMQAAKKWWAFWK
ncbi:hypothetical protein [Pseudoalteromonas rubra]|nr:hypothetical protein [Pseudoalteromonas rubra]